MKLNVGLPIKVKVETVWYLTLTTDVCLHFCTERKYSKNVKFDKFKADTHYRTYCPYVRVTRIGFKLQVSG